MNQSYPVPPPELVRKWATWRNAVDEESFWRRLAIEAAQWGADQELEACCEWLTSEGLDRFPMRGMREARRPKPPSLKEQALDQLRRVNAILQFQTDGGETSVIRRALEALDD